MLRPVILWHGEKEVYVNVVDPDSNNVYIGFYIFL